MASQLLKSSICKCLKLIRKYKLAQGMDLSLRGTWAPNQNGGLDPLHQIFNLVEVGGVEPPSASSVQKASTCLVQDLISSAGRP